MISKEKREEIRVRLSELEHANGGRLTPSAVVDDAQDEGSPLHDHFEWDDDKAAHAYRLSQARELITSIKVVQRTETVNIRAVYYVRDPSAQPEEQGYVSVPTLRSDADMAREALVNEFSRVADMLRRARELAAALNAQGDVEELLTRVVGLRQRFMEPAEMQQ
jgi:hypothetical protein